MLSPAEGAGPPPGYETAGNSDYALFDDQARSLRTVSSSCPFTKNNRVSNSFVPRVPRAAGESYWQGLNLGGCVGCHGGQGQIVGGDFSVIVARGRVVTPEAPELEAGQAAAFSAAAPAQSLEQLNAYTRALNFSTMRNAAVLYGK